MVTQCLHIPYLTAPLPRVDVGDAVTSSQIGTCFSGRLGDLPKVTSLGELGFDLGFTDFKSSVLFTKAKLEPCYSKVCSTDWQHPPHLTACSKFRIAGPTPAESESVLLQDAQVLCGHIKESKSNQSLLSMTTCLHAIPKPESKQKATMQTSQN